VQDAQSQLFQPLQLNQDGSYTARPLDSLDTIAARELHMAGQPATRSAIAGEVQNIIQMNQDRYPTLACNPQMLGNGWTLRLGHPEAMQPQQQCAPQTQYDAPQPARMAQPAPPAEVPPPPRPVVEAAPAVYQPNPVGAIAGGLIGGALLALTRPRWEPGYYYGGAPAYYGGGYYPHHYWHHR
jgi:hypothetical protein